MNIAKSTRSQRTFARTRACASAQALPLRALLAAASIAAGLPATVRAQPANDSCSNATVVPATAVTYNPPQIDVSSALTDLCAPAHSCGSGAISKDVYYTFTPALDGSITVDTFGSNYDTLLSAFSSCRGFCGFPTCCANPLEYACGDNYFFNDQSQILVDVEAGETYIFKISALDATGGELLDFNLRWRPPNDLCAEATPINGVIYSSPLFSTVHTQTDTCEAPESCEVNNAGTSNTVWYAYTPACDGFLTVDTEGSAYDTVLSIHDGCGIFYGVDIPCDYPDEIACDDDGGTGTLSRIADLPVTAGVEYLIKVADYSTAQGGGLLRFNLRFDGADAPVAEITSPVSYDCACTSTPVIGTADQPLGTFAGYVLDYMPVGGSNWTVITTSGNPVTNGPLGTWNTSALSQGTYLLRLTVTNGCGGSASAVEVIYVDGPFASLDLTGPSNTVVGGKVCPHGTAWDVCFEDYAVEYAPSGSGAYQPVDAASPVYTAAVTNDPLLPVDPWDTVADGIADGDYDLRLTGTTSCAAVADDVAQIIIDNTAPTAAITAPLDCAVVDGVVEITGTAQDANLAGWSLQYTGGGAPGWVTIDSDTLPVNNGVLGHWDTSALPDCAYVLRLVVTDSANLDCNGAIHHSAEYTVGVLLGDCGDFDADNDGDVDLADYAAFMQVFTGPQP